MKERTRRTVFAGSARTLTTMMCILLIVLHLYETEAVMPFLRSYTYSKTHQSNPTVYTHNRPSVWMTKYPSPLKQDVLSDQPKDSVLFGTGSPFDDRSDAGPQRDSLSPALNAVDPGTYYADWHQMLHGQGTHRCMPIPANMSLCQDVGYRRMVLPNYLQHEELKEAVDQSQVWVSLAHTECHPDLKRFLCALYAPVCVEEYPEQLIHPCSDLCEDVRQSCLPKMLQFGFGWPEIVKCSRFPASLTKMCVPLTAKKRPRCSGCVEEPTFESVVSSYCMADVAIRARILHVSRSNQSAGSTYMLQLEPRPKMFKVASGVRRFPYLNIEVNCECGILDKALSDDKNRLRKWLIMGKLSNDHKTLNVEHLSRIRKQNHGLKRALRAIRHPSPNLCRLTLPHSRQAAVSPAMNRTPIASTEQTGPDAPQTETPGPKRSHPRLRARAHPNYVKRPRNTGYHVARPEPPMAPQRRSLVRRSQKYTNRPAVPMSYAMSPPGAPLFVTEKPPFTNRLEWPPTRPYRGRMLSRSDLSLSPKPTIKDINPPLETEKDLFAPQNLIPWL